MRMLRDLRVISVSMKAAVLVLILLALSACGAFRAVRETERLVDEYECLLREIDGDLTLQASSLKADARGARLFRLGAGVSSKNRKIEPTEGASRPAQ